MTPDLPLIKGVLTPLAKSIPLPFGVSAAMSAKDAAVQKKTNVWISYNNINNFNERYYEKISWKI